MSDEHFTVDGTVLEAWASLKSFQRKDAGPTPPPDDPGNPTVNFHGETRKNDTHASTTDPDAQLYRKGQGKEAKLAYLGHVLLDNRHGLVANVCATAATGTGEWEAALLMLAQAPHATTVGGRQEFRRRPLRRAGAPAGDHAARGAEGRRLADRRAHHPASGLRRQSTQTETDRAGLRLDEDHRRAAQAAAPRRRARRLDRDLHRGGLQPGPAAHTAGEARMSAASPPAGRPSGRH